MWPWTWKKKAEQAEAERDTLEKCLEAERIAKAAECKAYQQRDNARNERDEFAREVTVLKEEAEQHKIDLGNCQLDVKVLRSEKGGLQENLEQHSLRSKESVKLLKMQLEARDKTIAQLKEQGEEAKERIEVVEQDCDRHYNDLVNCQAEYEKLEKERDKAQEAHEKWRKEAQKVCSERDRAREERDLFKQAQEKAVIRADKLKAERDQFAERADQRMPLLGLIEPSTAGRGRTPCFRFGIYEEIPTKENKLRPLCVSDYNGVPTEDAAYEVINKLSRGDIVGRPHDDAIEVDRITTRWETGEDHEEKP